MVKKEPPDISEASQPLASSPDHSVEKIIQENILCGRFERVRKYQGGALTLEAYRAIVTLYYIEHHSMISQLRANDSETWEHLWQSLFDRAYRLLCGWGWPTDQAYTRAQEATQEACFSIHKRPYPYDCPFNAWATKILRDCVFRSYHRPRNPLDLPGVMPLIDEQRLSTENDPPEVPSTVENQDLLLRALGHLRSPPQRKVIECLFLEGLSPEETAQRLGKSVQAIYNLKGRALIKLRQLLKEATKTPPVP